MRDFPLFASHLDLAHQLWKQFLKKEMFVIDATCGNGHDTFFLGQTLVDLGGGTLVGIDIQKMRLKRRKLN